MQIDSGFFYFSLSFGSDNFFGFLACGWASCMLCFLFWEILVLSSAFLFAFVENQFGDEEILSRFASTASWNLFHIPPPGSLPLSVQPSKPLSLLSSHFTPTPMHASVRQDLPLFYLAPHFSPPSSPHPHSPCTIRLDEPSPTYLFSTASLLSPVSLSLSSPSYFLTFRTQLQAPFEKERIG